MALPGSIFFGDVHLLAKFPRKGDQHTNYEPGGKAYQDPENITPCPVFIGEQHQEIPSLYIQLFDLVKHARLKNRNSQ